MNPAIEFLNEQFAVAPVQKDLDGAAASLDVLTRRYLEIASALEAPLIQPTKPNDN